MKNLSVVLFVLALVVGRVFAADQPDGKINVLVITGGHGFKPGPFFAMFEENPQIRFTAASHALKPGESATAYDRDDLGSFDVVVLYDMASTMTEGQRAKFLALFEKGTGVIVLHHAYLSYPTWPEYERIAGGSYVYTQEQRNTGLTSSNYTREMVEIPVTVANPTHPVLVGLADFVLRDELYTNMHMVGAVTPLLKTNSELLAWARTEKKSRIVGTILGHGAGAHDDPNFRKFLASSIRWVARR